MNSSERPYHKAPVSAVAGVQRRPTWVGVVGGVMPPSVNASWAAGSSDDTTLRQHSNAAAPLQPAAVWDRPRGANKSKAGISRRKYVAVIVAEVPFEWGVTEEICYEGRLFIPEQKSSRGFPLYFTRGSLNRHASENCILSTVAYTPWIDQGCLD